MKLNVSQSSQVVCKLSKMVRNQSNQDQDNKTNKVKNTDLFLMRKIQILGNNRPPSLSICPGYIESREKKLHVRSIGSNWLPIKQG